MRMDHLGELQIASCKSQIEKLLARLQNLLARLKTARPQPQQNKKAITRSWMMAPVFPLSSVLTSSSGLQPRNDQGAKQGNPNPDNVAGDHRRRRRRKHDH
jgi:hypothetical protein